MARHRGRAPRLPSRRRECKNKGLAVSLRAETFVAKHVACLHCGGRLRQLPPNTRERDLECVDCHAGYQVKAVQRGSSELLAGADFFITKLAVVARLNSAFMLLVYDEDRVMEVWATPSHLIPLASIFPKGRRLGPHTRRAGTLNCYVDAGQIPTESRVYLLKDGTFVPSDEIEARWAEVARLAAPVEPTWLSDIASELYLRTGRYPRIDDPQIRRGRPFRLDDLYALEGALASRHPRDGGVRRAIRMAVAELARLGVLERLGNGAYRLLPTRKQACDEAV